MAVDTEEEEGEVDCVVEGEEFGKASYFEEGGVDIFPDGALLIYTEMAG